MPAMNTKNFEVSVYFTDVCVFYVQCTHISEKGENVFQRFFDGAANEMCAKKLSELQMERLKQTYEMK